MTATTWTITDGTTTINLLGSTWAVLNSGSWAPAVATRDANVMGGRSVYADVDENPLHLTIVGADKGDCLTELQTLIDLLDQAERWARGEDVDVVYMQYQPSNSDVGVNLKRIIKGPPGFGTFITLPASAILDVPDGGKRIGTDGDPLVLQYRASGLWYGNTETESASASSGNPEEVTTTTFTDNPNILWPYNLNLTFTRTGANNFQDMAYKGFIALVNAATKISFFEAESGSLTDQNFTSTVVAGSSGGSVMRMDGGVGQTDSQIGETTIGGISGVNEIRVFSMMRNRSASTISYDVYLQWSETGTTSYKNGRKLTIDTSNNDPQLLDMGSMYKPPGSSWSDYNWAIQVEASTIVSVGDELEIDWICLIGVDDSTRIFEFTNFINSSQSNDTTITFSIDHQLDSQIVPAVFSELAWPKYEPFGGDAVLMASGNAITAIALLHDASNADWVMEDDGGGEVTYTLSVTRTRAYLVPQ